MSGMDALEKEIQEAAVSRQRAEEAFLQADAKLKDLLVKGRAGGLGPSQMAKLTGFTREWVAKIAPDPKRSRQNAIQRRLDRNAAGDIADSD
ncbi:hypothetical protein [Streptomyces sp. NRRL B-24720]|uniref:hypothetical protein n=1 Tax=Streptomyces sp. NRRL B-24720 TaxID=1476876 RepID=UPI00131BB6DB|nr:hypothetical protein [Streptomyces sp. NRRL B-24720]